MEDSYRIREQRKRSRIQYIKDASFKHYIRKVLRRFRAPTSISRDAVHVIDSIIFDLFHSLAAEASELMVHTGKRTLTAHDVQFACIRYFRGQVARHAVSEGQKAVHMFADMSR